MSESTSVPADTGDLIQPDDADVTPVEVQPGDPDYVEPYAGATRPYVSVP